MQDEHGLWNGFFSFMCRHLSLSAWTTASSIVRATSKSIDGPYEVQQMAVQPWAHNAFLTRDPPTKVRKMPSWPRSWANFSRL